MTSSPATLLTYSSLPFSSFVPSTLSSLHAHSVVSHTSSCLSSNSDSISASSYSSISISSLFSSFYTEPYTKVLTDWGAFFWPPNSSQSNTTSILHHFNIGAGPLRPDRWQFHLQDFPDPLIASQLLRGLREGFCLGYTGPRTTFIPTRQLSPAAITTLRANYISEVALDRMVGPLSADTLNNIFPFFRVSLSFLIPKPDGTHRRIDNMSFPAGSSINDFISKYDFPVDYAMPEHVHDDIATCPTGARFSCRDIASAYRQVLVHPADWNLLVLALSDELFFSPRLVMGLVSACGIFHRLSSATVWIILHVTPTLVIARSILDDFMLQHGSACLDLLSPSDASLIDKHIFEELRQTDLLLRDLGWPVNEAKSVNNVTSFTWLGIGWSSLEHACFLPEDKAFRYGDLVSSVLDLDSPSIPLSLGRSLVGKLVWASRIVPQSRTRLYYIFRAFFAAETRFRTLRSHISSIQVSSIFIHFCEHAIHDLRWWRSIFDLPPVRRCRILDYESPEFTITTDAAPTGGVGGYFRHSCFSFRFTPLGRTFHSTFAELLALVVAVLLWGAEFSGHSLFWRTDCEAHVRGLFKLRTSAPDLLPLHDLLDYLAVKHNFIYAPKHLRGEHNGFADWLSRDCLHEAALPTSFRLCRTITDPPDWLSDLLLLND